MSGYFRDEVLPALTPLAIDISRPFPMLSSLSLNLAFRLAPSRRGHAGPSRDRSGSGRISAARPRLGRRAGVRPARRRDPVRSRAAVPWTVRLEAATFRLLRDSELDLDDEGGRSYLEALEKELRKRRRSAVVRLEVEQQASDSLLRCFWHTRA